MHQDKLIAPQTATAAGAGGAAGASSKKSSSEMSSTIWKLSLKQSAKTFCISCVFALWSALISVDNSFILPACFSHSHSQSLLIHSISLLFPFSWLTQLTCWICRRLSLSCFSLSCIACWRCAWKTRRGCCCCCFELLAKVSAASKPNWCSTSRLVL